MAGGRRVPGPHETRRVPCGRADRERCGRVDLAALAPGRPQTRAAPAHVDHVARELHRSVVTGARACPIWRRPAKAPPCAATTAWLATGGSAHGVPICVPVALGEVLGSDHGQPVKRARPAGPDVSRSDGRTPRPGRLDQRAGAFRHRHGGHPHRQADRSGVHLSDLTVGEEARPQPGRPARAEPLANPSRRMPGEEASGCGRSPRLLLSRSSC